MTFMMNNLRKVIEGHEMISVISLYNGCVTWTNQISSFSYAPQIVHLESAMSGSFLIK